MLYQNRLFKAVVAQDGVSPFAPGTGRDTAFLDLHTFDDTGGTVGVIGGFGIGVQFGHPRVAESLLRMVPAAVDALRDGGPARQR